MNEAHAGLRQTATEIAAIKRIAAEHFGPDAQVQGFGSRTRPEVRGGDLDLHVRAPDPLPASAKEYRVLDRIMAAMDDLQVDRWFGSARQAPDAYAATALGSAIRL